MNYPLPQPLNADVHTLNGAAGAVTVYAGGSGPPVLLVHSINALASAAEVRPLFEALRQDNSVYALDLPGYGLSQRLPRAYTVSDMCNAIRLVAQWVSQRHLDLPLQVVGVSLSCEFVARVAQQMPGFFNTMALVSPTGFRGGKSLRQPEGSTMFIAGINRFLRHPGPGWSRVLFGPLLGATGVGLFIRRTRGWPRLAEKLWGD
jgi:pimeloyl-ACP methyl ester carboxylesterase